MSESREHQETPWRRKSSPAIARQALADGTLVVQIDDADQRVRIVGHCPICEADIDEEFPRSLQAAFRPQHRQGGKTTHLLECHCMLPHEGQRAGEDGCGLSISISAEP